MGGWKYAKSILQNWLNAGIKTIEQIQAEEIQFKNKGKKVETEAERKERMLQALKEVENEN